jgi:hypothetical protein
MKNEHGTIIEVAQHGTKYKALNSVDQAIPNEIKNDR